MQRGAVGHGGDFWPRSPAPAEDPQTGAIGVLLAEHRRLKLAVLLQTRALSAGTTVRELRRVNDQLLVDVLADEEVLS